MDGYEISWLRKIVQQKPKSTQQQQQSRQQHKTHQRTLYEEDSELGKITQQNQISTQHSTPWVQRNPHKQQQNPQTQ
jgi:hypothetical protein